MHKILRKTPIVILLMILIASLVACSKVHFAKPNGYKKSLKILHFSDYHSSAVVQYDDTGNEFAGIARSIGFLKLHDDPTTLIFNGGDMMNKGAPAWSDKYRCEEWSWFNGLVDAMALGNHDSDYGPEQLTRCLENINYPLLSANTLGADDKPAFSHKGQSYSIHQVGDIKVGAFALAGSDFTKLINDLNAPVFGAKFTSRVATAHTVVEQLRNQQKVDLVVLIGHSHFEDDLALAQHVSGIDIILGSHSHRVQPLIKIDNTQTWYVSAGQYLSHIAEIDIEILKGRDSSPQVLSIKAELVPMSAKVVEDKNIAERVNLMQRQLENDSKFSDQFKVIGRSHVTLSAPRLFKQDSILGNYVGDTVRKKSDIDVAMFTSSTFRKSIPSGDIKEHHLTDAMPYDNQLYIYSVTGDELMALLGYSVSRQDSDFFSQLSGVKIGIENSELSSVEIGEGDQWEALLGSKLYTLITSDYQSKVADGYKDVLANKPHKVFEQSLREIVRNELKRPSVVPVLDGRIRSK